MLLTLGGQKLKVPVGINVQDVINRIEIKYPQYGKVETISVDGVIINQENLGELFHHKNNLLVNFDHESLILTSISNTYCLELMAGKCLLKLDMVPLRSSIKDIKDFLAQKYGGLVSAIFLGGVEVSDEKIFTKDFDLQYFGRPKVVFANEQILKDIKREKKASKLPKWEKKMTKKALKRSRKLSRKIPRKALHLVQDIAEYEKMMTVLGISTPLMENKIIPSLNALLASVQPSLAQ